MNKAQLVVDVKNLIGPAGKGSEVDDSGITVWLNDAYDMVKSAIMDAKPDYYGKSATSATVASQQEYDLPSDFEKMLLVSLSYDGTNFVRAYPLNTINQSGNATTSIVSFNVAQPFYYIIENRIGLNPVPTLTSDATIKIWYTYDPGLMVEDTDTPDIPRRFQSILKYWAYANYLDQNDEHVSSERQRVRFEASLDKLVSQLVGQQVDQSNTVEVLNDDQGLYVNNY